MTVSLSIIDLMFSCIFSDLDMAYNAVEHC